jgi:hypothetical protein
VLHDRTAFREGLDEPRLLYRARYHDRIATSLRSWQSDTGVRHRCQTPQSDTAV